MRLRKDAITCARLSSGSPRISRKERRTLMPATLILLPGALALAALLHFERRQDRRGMVPVKTGLSCLFIAAALLQGSTEGAYFRWLVTGLILCLAGDVLLALPQQRAFLAGIGAFLLGHVAYVAAFFQLTEADLIPWIGATVTLVVSGAVYRWLWPHLGDMKFAVLAYVVVISLMVCTALALFRMDTLALPGRRLVLVGAVLFYVSDLFVARDRFVSPGFENRLIGLPLYYAGQFMIAFSLGPLGA
ncbi:MAG: lysoplasmalogenase [Deltaproteobacteria bacterium]|nr:MAG: lysoplasmalogenase [Deltaproteobacteria bacterium]